MTASGIAVRSLGWAGIELAAGEATLLIDPLADPGAVFSPLGAGADPIVPPEVVPPDHAAAAGALVTHLHRDHADAGAIASGIAPAAAVLGPARGDGEGAEELGLAQAEHELHAAGLELRRLTPWEQAEIGPFAVTALPAVDGTGDPQVSWLVEAAGCRIAHFGDTMFHGHWWRIALRAGPIDLALVPINGAVLDFPHRRPPSPLPGVMDPEQAAEAVGLLGARAAVPIHYGGYGGSRFYRPAERPLERFLAAADRGGWEPRPLAPGETFELAPAPVS
jgi:L-ascorbate metabolism protein UlaG (beta-lactamase superfamily)